jgi:hypothetical protein
MRKRSAKLDAKQLTIKKEKSSSFSPSVLAHEKVISMQLYVAGLSKYQPGLFLNWLLHHR